MPFGAGAESAKSKNKIKAKKIANILCPSMMAILKQLNYTAHTTKLRSVIDQSWLSSRGLWLRHIHISHLDSFCHWSLWTCISFSSTDYRLSVCKFACFSSEKDKFYHNRLAYPGRKAASFARTNFYWLNTEKWGVQFTMRKLQYGCTMILNIDII